MTIVEEGDKYTDVLPSLNLALEMPHDMKLRFGAAITVARPRLDELGGGASYTVTSDQSAPAQFQWAALLLAARRRWQSEAQSPGRRTPSTCRSRNTSATQGLCLGGGLLQGPEDLHLQSVGGRRVSTVCRCPRCSRATPTTYNTADANRMGVSTLKTNGSGGYVQGFEITASIPFDVVRGRAGGLRPHRQRQRRTAPRSRSMTKRRRCRACPRRSSTRRCTTSGTAFRRA